MPNPLPAPLDLNLVLNSPAIRRLIEEVRQEREKTPNPTSYNRTYNRMMPTHPGGYNRTYNRHNR